MSNDVSPRVPVDPLVWQCLCSFAQRMQGDGCHICNPGRAATLADEARAEDYSDDHPGRNPLDSDDDWRGI